jgi:hypothetical protein
MSERRRSGRAPVPNPKYAQKSITSSSTHHAGEPCVDDEPDENTFEVRGLQDCCWQFVRFFVRCLAYLLPAD